MEYNKIDDWADMAYGLMISKPEDLLLLRREKILSVFARAEKRIPASMRVLVENLKKEILKIDYKEGMGWEYYAYLLGVEDPSDPWGVEIRLWQIAAETWNRLIKICGMEGNLDIILTLLKVEYFEFVHHISLDDKHVDKYLDLIK